MERPPSRKPPTAADSTAEVRHDIDAVYGLEPVFEPGREASGVAEAALFHSIQCPYCGERFDTLIDVGAGAATYIEDCQICCQPIEFELQVDSQGAFAGLSVHRS